MSKATGRVWRGGALLFVGFGLALLLGLSAVDHEPYFRAPFYQETTARLDRARSNLTLVEGTLEVGFGRALLQPALGAAADEPEQGRFRTLPLAGYGGRKGQPATGVHDDIYAKALAVRVQEQVGVLVSVDALIIPREVAALALEQIEHDLGLARDQVYLSATHTHASLGGWGEGFVAEAFAGGFQPGIRLWFASRLVESVRAALDDLSPASLGQGGFAAPEHIRNRLVGPLGMVDSEFRFLLAKQADGDVGVLGSYGAHATVLPSSNMEISGDYPGAWQRAVEKATGGMALFLAGGVGSHAPVAGGNDFAAAERMGESLARALLERASHLPLTNQVRFGRLRLTVSLPSVHVRLSDGTRLRAWLGRRLLPVGETTFLQGLRLNDVTWVGTPCDFSGELALGIKDTFRGRGIAVAITSFNGDYIGYVVPHRYYHLDSYETRVMSFFGPNLPDYLDELVRSLVVALNEGPR